MTIKDPQTWKWGDDETYGLEFYSRWVSETDNDPLDITGRTYVMNVAAASGQTVLLTDNGAVSGAAGTVLFSFLRAAIMAALTVETWRFWVVETDASGLENTIVEGSLVLEYRGEP